VEKHNSFTPINMIPKERNHYSKKIRVSIGLPVFNGERYLSETIESILKQTYSDFELIISDNASTDATKNICLHYANQDRRIRYFRNKTNIGAAKNFNRVFKLSAGIYFKWAAYDDLYASEYLERCVEVLDNFPSVVIVHSRTGIIDEHSNYLRDYDDLLHFSSLEIHKRFRQYLFRQAWEWNAIFGLIRASELKNTPLIGGYISADQVLLGELILRGKIYQIPKILFFRRDHPQNSWKANPMPKALACWFDPLNKHKFILPKKWKHFFEYIHSIKRSPMKNKERMLCYLYLLLWRRPHFVCIVKKWLNS